MSNKLLLVSGNFYPEPTGIGKYCGEMVDWLSDNGYDCTVITTFPYYPDWKVNKLYSKSRYWYKKEIKQPTKVGSLPITIIRCPHYIPTNPTGFKRLLSEVTISFFSYFALLSLVFSKRFQFVLCVAPPFAQGLLGVLYKKIRQSIFMYHIQDLQIDAARELGMIKSSIALKCLTRIENYIIGCADHVSTISEGMIRKVSTKSKKEVILFPNWVNTSNFFPIADKELIKAKFGFLVTDKIILYSGAIGVKQGLHSMILSAKEFKNDKNVKFIICGNGPYKTHLQKFKEQLQLDNVIFTPLQKPEDLNEFLNIADIHLIIQKSTASDLMLPSKLSTILAVGGVAVVTAVAGTGLYNIMKSRDMGVITHPDNQDALNEAIRHCLNIDLTQKRTNARTYAKEHFCLQKVLPEYINRISQIPNAELSRRGKQKVILS